VAGVACRGLVGSGSAVRMPGTRDGFEADGVLGQGAPGGVAAWRASGVVLRELDGLLGCGGARGEVPPTVRAGADGDAAASAQMMDEEIGLWRSGDAVG